MCLYLVGSAQDTLRQTVLLKSTNVEALEKRMSLLEKQIEENESSILNNMQLGLSFGFNYFFNGEQHYFIKADSTLGVYGKKHGISGMLSALLGYKINERSSILLNVPLGDLSGNANQAIGVFNKKVAGGLGYGYNVGEVSFILVINIFPYEEVALEIIKNKKFEQEPFTVANTQEIPTTTAYSPSITLGVCYNFLKTGVLGY